MKPTQKLHDLGQSIWVDNISRGMINSGTLRRYIDELSVTGLTSNPTIFDHAVAKSSDYDEMIRSKVAQGLSGEKLFFELALEDLTQAADMFRPIHERTAGLDGFVSLEVSPLLAHDTKKTTSVAKALHDKASGRTCSSKFRARPKACRRSRNRFLPACNASRRSARRASTRSARRSRH